MKKIFLAMATLTALSAISTASADSLGLRGTYLNGFYGNDFDPDGSFSIGVQYTRPLNALDSVRGSLDLYPKMYGADKAGFGVELAYLHKLPTALSRNANLNVYVGGGLGLDYVSASDSSSGVKISANVTTVNPTLLVGVNYFVNPDLAVYAELAGGPSFIFASASAGGYSASDNVSGGFIHPRIGLTYTLRR